MSCKERCIDCVYSIPKGFGDIRSGVNIKYYCLLRENTYSDILIEVKPDGVCTIDEFRSKYPDDSKMFTELKNMMIEEQRKNNGLSELNIMPINNGIAPTQAHNTDAGFDLYAPVDFEIGAFQKFVKVPARIAIDLPKGYYAQIVGRSGLAFKHNITVSHIGTIDSGYTGEINILLSSDSPLRHEFKRGDRIAQMVIMKHESPEIVVVDELGESERGSKGFGSSGK